MSERGRSPLLPVWQYLKDLEGFKQYQIQAFVDTCWRAVLLSWKIEHRVTPRIEYKPPEEPNDSQE